MKKKTNTRSIGIMALFISIGLVLQYIESRILITPLPGGKLGLTNIVSIINIFMFGGRNALLISVFRSFWGSLLTGGVMTMAYSVTGAFFSSISMWFIKKILYPKVSIIGISIIGAATHNVSQLIVAVIFYSSVYVMSYLPILLVLSLVSGFITGSATHIFAKRALKEDIRI
ncbi:MAG: Gx transporter family protein [Clostridia bacterium]|nr:Gx transporter family protein [Clostridia bacterium]